MQTLSHFLTSLKRRRFFLPIHRFVKRQLLIDYFVVCLSLSNIKRRRCLFSNISFQTIEKFSFLRSHSKFYYQKVKRLYLWCLGLRSLPRKILVLKGRRGQFNPGAAHLQIATKRLVINLDPTPHHSPTQYYTFIQNFEWLNIIGRTNHM